MNYDICVLGLGYIGLPTASIFATRGKKVLGVDVAPAVVETINAGKIHIQEPDLDVLVRAAVQSGNLRADHHPAPAATYIIAVPTPFRKDAHQHKTPDLSYVEEATRSLATVVPAHALIILESTSPVGTTEKVRGWLLDELHRVRAAEAAALGSTLRFAHCPERILPGQMLKELVSNDRIAGGLTPDAAQSAKTLYRAFCTGEIFLTDARTAEMAKLTENSFRDVNIAFANELSLICEKLDINVWELIRLANRHPRVKILQPGPGVGGHCIAVDPWFIVDAAPDEARLIRTAREVNDHKPTRVLEWIKTAAVQFPRPVVACLGLAFKADVDDLRESPAVEIVERLAHDFPGEILAVEPHIKTLPSGLAATGKVKLTDAASAVSRANVIVLLVNHRVFADVDRQQFASKTVIDTRGFWK
jgi:UDP-N-acetyl-D-mannosaminuronic acid dehydrogenase